MMTVSRKALEVVNAGGSTRAWVRPAVQRLAAGCAENGAPAGTPDTGVNFS
jgi:hypothetical protein